MKLRRTVLFMLACMLTTISLVRGEELVGGGASFPYPFYSKIFSEYQKLYGGNINYQSIGSGGGIRQIKKQTIDFGGTDAFLPDEDSARSSLLHIPTCMGAVVVVYNLNLGSERDIRLTPDVLADIFLGKVKKWNHKRIAEINKGIKLPDKKITVVHRSDGSGTTAIFTDYLSKVSSEWKKKVGKGTAVNWPTGLGGKGNEGVAGLIKQIPNSIGYVELIYAIQNKIPYAWIKNKRGNFIKPSLESTSESANVSLPEDMRISLTDTDAENGYPISGFTYILVYKEQNYKNRDIKKVKYLKQLLKWIISDGQKFAASLHYAPLPEEARKKAEKLIESMTYNGNPIK